MLNALLKSFREKKTEAEIPTPDLSRVLPHLRKSSEAPAAKGPLPMPEPAPAPAPEIEEDADLFDPEEESAAPSSDTPPAEFDVSTWIERDVSALQSAFKTYVERPGRPELHRQLFLAAHNLRGAAAPYGRPTIERIAGSLCQLLEGTDAQAPIVAIVKLHVDAIRAAATLPEGSAQEELANTVCIALEDQVRARLA